MLILSIQHIIFVECFHPCIVLQVFIATFLIGGMRMLQAFLCHHQIYFSPLSHVSPLTLKFNLSRSPSSLPRTSSPPNFQHVSSSIKICLFLMTLFNAILLKHPTQYILVFNISTDSILFFLGLFKILL